MNVYEIVTDKIVSKLEEGVIPWRKSWVCGPAKSLTTGKEYRGINHLLLKLSEFSSRYWVTYKQAEKLGGTIRKGEKSTPVIYWHWRTEEELAKLRAKTQAPAPCYPFVAFVFNLDQTERIERPDDDVPANNIQSREKAERIVASMPMRPKITQGASLSPCYSLLQDEVFMPTIRQFDCEAHYYGAFFHELAHSTGHRSRLDRFESRVGETRDERYSFEELVAELGAAFLCSASDVDNSATVEEASSYIAGWLKALKDDKKLLLLASSAAQKAADFIQGKDDAMKEENVALVA